jgi:hypothetical protein
MRRIPGRWVLALMTAALALMTTALASCSSGVSPSNVSPNAPGSPRTSPTGSPGPGASEGSVFGAVQDNPALTQTPAGLYLSTYPGQPGQSPPATTLARLSEATGRITSRHVFGPGYLSPPVAGAGSLWVTIANNQGESLDRLNPVTLAATGQVLLTSKQAALYAGETWNRVTFAGDAVWVAAVDQFYRVSPGSLKVTSTVPFPGADSSTIGASSDGHVLVLSEAEQGVGAIERHEPVTGAKQASHPMTGVVAARVSGVTDTGVWITEPTGMLGYVERFTAAGLTPQPATEVKGTNGIRAMLADGSLWITSPVGGARMNYCADPTTGHRRAQIPLPNPAQDYLLAVGPDEIYYTVPAQNGSRLERAPVPAACRA